MLVISDGVISDDINPWEQNIVKDSLTGNHYEILWDGSVIYTSLTVDNIILLDLVDTITNITYQIFVYDGVAFFEPTKNTLGNVIYGKECFIPAGGTVLLNIERNSTDIATVSDIEVKVLDKDTEDFLFIDSTLTQIKENMFKVTLVLPFKGNFLVLVKVMGTTYLNTELSTYQYTYDELLRELIIIDTKLNKDKYVAYM